MRARFKDRGYVMDEFSSCLIRQPVAPSAVAILHTDGSVDDCRLSDALAASGVAVVSVPRGVDFEVGLQIAAVTFDSSLPRMVAASGSAVPAAQRAARRNGLFGAVLLNAPI